MATDAGYAKYVLDQLANAGGMTVLKMFGEYGLYRHGKIVALICDNQLFVKPTVPGEAVLGTPTYGEAYPGSKQFFNVSDLLDDPERLVRLIVVTDEALPAAKKKGAKKSAAQKPAAKKAAAKKAAAKKPAAKKTAAKKTAAARKPAARTAGAKKQGKRPTATRGTRTTRAGARARARKR